MVRAKRLLATIAASLLATVSGCTVHKTDAPDLTGPSELSTSIQMQANPDVLTQDGASQSTITVTARNANAQPIRSLSLRADITVGGLTADFGRLSARNLVTDANGQATVVYTAPLPLGCTAAACADSGTVVGILFTPVGSDYGNTSVRAVNIRLVPEGTIVPPSALQASFTFSPSAPSDHQTVIFDGSASQPTTGQGAIVSYSWDFGDGSYGSGITAQHDYRRPDSYPVTLTVTDGFGNSKASTPQAVNVGQGDLPSANFTSSPASPIPDQTVFFNGSSSTPAVGRRIASYAWDFGDGSSASGVQPSHAYHLVGNYTVTLKVTDDLGRIGVKSGSVNVQADTPPTAQFTSTPVGGHTMAFDASGATAGTGRRIVSYTWSFGDGDSGNGAAVQHSYLAAGSYTVTLTVVDDTGKSGSKVQVVTVP